MAEDAKWRKIETLYQNENGCQALAAKKQTNLTTLHELVFPR
jgi:hypothetical protein